MEFSSRDRRGFLISLIGAAAGLVITQVGCGSSSGSGGNSGTSGGGSSTPTSGGNCDSDGSELETTGSTESHTHTFQLTAAQIQAADPNAVFTTSSVGHTHTVQLTAQDYAELSANQGVSLTTGAATDGHTHSLVINCA